MSLLDIARTSYGRMIRVPVFGALVAFPVRLVKRLFSDPNRRFWSKLDLAVSASAAMRNDLDGAAHRIEDLEREVVRLKLMVKQQTAVLESIGFQASAGDARPERLVVRIDWSDGASREVTLPVEAGGRQASNGGRPLNGANGTNGGPRNGASHAKDGTRTRQTGS